NVGGDAPVVCGRELRQADTAADRRGGRSATRPLWHSQDCLQPKPPQRPKPILGKGPESLSPFRQPAPCGNPSVHLQLLASPRTMASSSVGQQQRIRRFPLCAFDASATPLPVYP